MLKLTGIVSNKIWGYENWIASTHDNGLQEDFLKALGGKYPLLIKVIQANESLSVQVHPDDEWACKLEGEGSVGKTECWYVLQADKGAKLVYGLKGKHTREDLESAINSNTLEKYLNQVQVHTGDFIFIPSGTVHAIGGGLRLLEVQQSCDITYRLYDWGRPRELHVSKALDVIKNTKLPKIQKFKNNFSCDYFSLSKISIKDSCSITCASSEEKVLPKDFELIFIIDGTVKAKSESGEECVLEKEDIIALHPEETVMFEGNAHAMYICSC